MTTADNQESTGMRWGVEKRFEFMEFRLYWEGRLNRKDLIDQFGISVTQSSLDLNRYLELAPGNMSYDKSARCYVAAEVFKPQFLKPDAHRYLAGLRSIADDVVRIEETWMGRLPVYEALPVPHRAVNPVHLRAILMAIREVHAIHIQYQSLSRPTPLWRWITPHAIASDGVRWHARAYCHVDAVFKDFLLGRVLDIGERKAHVVDADADHAWQRQTTVRIGPHPELTESQRRVVELDYGMAGGELVIPVRGSFLFYFLRQLRLLPESVERKPRDQQIVLLNRDEVMQTFEEMEGQRQ